MTSPVLAPSVPLVDRLAAWGERPALVSSRRTTTYADLARRVADVADRLGTTRRLVLVEATSTVDTVVACLAAFAGRHPLLLCGPGVRDGLEAAYSPDVVMAAGGLVERRPGTAHDLHPDLALLLSTSGTTGSPKLVRLSRRNVVSNARAIAEYLGLRPDDVAPTTLPLHYCYGLSLLTSHLSVGACVLLTERSVTDPLFWEDFRRCGATSLAGVPHTFDLLDRLGFENLDLPTLRYVTQAGGRLAPERVRRLADLGQRRGFDLYVMYGQTEATARMAYLPPDLAAGAPSSIGRPVPGGTLTVDRSVPHEDPDVGELVFSGPGVMLGYAHSPADLALGRTVDVLRTGDLARRRPDGLFEVVGRRSRFAKVFGLRIDLDRVEHVLAARGLVAAAADGGDRVVVGVSASGGAHDRATVSAVLDGLGLPSAGSVVLTLPELPRLPSGKTDYRALVERAAPAPAPAPSTPRTVDVATVVALYAELLERPDAGADDSFVDLGGDSLSYVEVSVRLEELLGRLPDDWPTTAPAHLVAVPVPRRRRGAFVETNVLLRAAAIVTVVGSHANLFTLLGGAHLLLAVVGYNVGRFLLPDGSPRQRAAVLLRATARIAVPSAVVIGAVALVTPGLGWRQALLVNTLTSRRWTEPAWHYWFVEAVVHILLALTVLLAVPAVARLARRLPFAFPVGLAVLGLLTRYGVVGAEGGDEIHRAHVVFWLFALGWAASRARTSAHRLLLTALVAASVPGFFDDPARDAYVVVGTTLLLWLPGLRVPAVVARTAGVLAAASLWIYLVHWQVYPHLETSVPWLATLLSLAAGVVARAAWVRGARSLGPGAGRGRRPAGLRRRPRPCPRPDARAGCPRTEEHHGHDRRGTP